jgi:hypothetical protein
MTDAAALMEALRRGEPIHLTDRPADPGDYSLCDSYVTAHRVGPGRYHFGREVVWNDGSCLAHHENETLDDDAAGERLAALLAERHVVTQPVRKPAAGDGRKHS